MGRKYDEGKLVRYEETIVLYRAESLASVSWLVLRNYAKVFETGKEKASQHEVVFHLVGAWEKQGKMVSILLGELPDPMDWIVVENIGVLFDVADIIRFQRAVIEQSSDSLLQKFKNINDYMSTLLRAGLEATVVYRLLTKQEKSPNDLYLEYLGLSSKLPRGLDPDLYREYERLGFTAYFPNTSLILEEERTLFEPGKGGKTQNIDTRLIKPIMANMTRPPQFVFDEFFKDFDESQLTDEEKKKAEKGKLKRTGNRVQELPRLCCYAFRGDGRDPIAIKNARGLLPSLTRSDSKYMESFKFDLQNALIKELDKKETGQDFLPPAVESALKDKGAVFPGKPSHEIIEEGKRWHVKAAGRTIYVIRLDIKTLTLKVYEPKTEQISNRPILDLEEELKTRLKKSGGDADAYYKSMLDLFMNLGKYTQKETFKGFLSTSLSIAIAKCFGNLYSSSADSESFLYAVRCVGGIQIPSTLLKFKPGDNVTTLIQEQHKLGFFAEQEIAVPGAVWWEHIVGFRLNRCDKQGQFLTGPVFLQDRLKTVDPKAFDALFELLSGKGQGDGPTIEKSYKQNKAARFDFVPNSPA